MKANRLLVFLVLVTLCCSEVCAYENNAGFVSFISDSDNNEYEANKHSIDLDYEEIFSIFIRRPEGRSPEAKQPIECLVKKIELFASKGEDFYSDEITFSGEDRERFIFTSTIKKLLSKAPWNISTKEVENIEVILKVIYYTGDEESSTVCSGLTPVLSSDRQVDQFFINVKHFGIYILFDLNPISDNLGGQFVDSVLGIFSLLESTSVDYPIVINPRTSEIAEFSNIMVSAPIVVIESRNWLQHFNLQAVLVKDVGAEGTPLGFGFSIGAIRPGGGNGTVVNLGAYNIIDTHDVNFFIGFSIPVLFKWLSGL